MTQKAYFIQYKFILPAEIKHSSYTYQKLFRALYGYTQNVTKSNGKRYKYFRNGVLSKVPYVRTGKNCVTIPPGELTKLTDFFKTGKNPTHYWHVKGDWKAVYYMDGKGITDEDACNACEALLRRAQIALPQSEPDSISNQLEHAINNKNTNSEYLKLLKTEAEGIINQVWFKETYKLSDKLNNFFNLYKSLP